MSDASYQRAKQIFHEVFELTGDERITCLETLCEGDDELRSRVERLLLGAEAPADDTQVFDIPESLGAHRLPMLEGYRMIRIIGQGGMGAVYEAAQRTPSRHVAIKVINAGQITGSLLARFEREAEVLARLRHPGITQVYESGIAAPLGGGGRDEDEGVPYLVMELVDGVPLTQYAETARLGVDDRLRLFVRLCDALEHAHQRGVIHRDLKPANILVESTG